MRQEEVIFKAPGPMRRGRVAGRTRRGASAWAFAVLLMIFWPAAALAQTPEETLKSAQQLERNGGQARAAKIYEQFLREHPDHSQVTEVRYRLGKCYDAVGMVDEAVSALKGVTDGPKQANFRNRPDAFYTLGKLYAANRKYDEAIATFEKMLAEGGAGLYEEEALDLLGGYYAIGGKYDLAASKFNILRRKAEGAKAEQAAYKLAMLWLRAEKMDLALAAIQDLANSFPSNQQIPELMLRAADAFRQKKEFEKTIVLCDQLRQRYPRSSEALGANLLLALCGRDKGEFQKAADALDALAKSREFQSRGLGAEAALQSAELYFKELKDPPKAMARYEEAARLARESEGDRRNEILEQCYFRLGEYQYQKRNYAVALDYYTMMRALGTKVNVLGRILECQNQLNKTSDSVAPEAFTETDIDLLKKKIAERPGTAEAAEGELFLLDRRFSELTRRRSGDASTLGAEYEKLARAYPREVLASQSMGAYAWQMAGIAYATGSGRPEMLKAVGAFEQCIAIDPSENNPYRQSAMENLAICAEKAGEKDKAGKAYAQLLEISRKRLDSTKQDTAAERKTLDYLKSLATRADTPQLIDQTIAMTRQLIEERGPLSELSRESRFYLGELYFLKKDYSSAAKTFREFIQVYGPKQDSEGNIAGGPWKPAKVDEKAQQVYDAAIRVAHAWFLQGHDQNMVQAYQWIARNLPQKNVHMAETQYFLSLELLKGKEGQRKERKRQAAEAMWKGVVSPNLPVLDQEESRARKDYHAWFADEDAQRFVRGAMMKAGELFGQVDDHESAAAAFKQFLFCFGGASGKAPKRGVRAVEGSRDDMVDIARYALGREYVALSRISKMIEVYKPYLTGHRDDRFRISGLRLIGFHAAKEGMIPEAIEAYATLLDEYGQNRVDEKGRAVPVGTTERLRPASPGWDGVRIAPPKGLDLGEVRFALGFLYWKTEDWPRCARTLAPFVDDPVLKGSKSRGQALFMAGQSCFKTYDYAGGAKFLRILVKELPRFEAIEEAYVWAAEGSARTGQWADLELLCRTFINEWPKSDRRPRIDLYAALAQCGQGRTDAAKKALLSIAQSDTFEDVKADAYYHLGRYAAGSDAAEAMGYFEKSVAWPRESSLLEAGRCAMKLRKWEQARDYLERCTGLRGDPKVIAEAKELLGQVQKMLKK